MIISDKLINNGTANVQVAITDKLNSVMGSEYDDKNYTSYQEALDEEISQMGGRLETVQVQTQLINQDRHHKLLFLRESNGRLLERAQTVLGMVESVEGEIGEIVARTIKLDCAHRQLTNFITILERLRAFINNIDELERRLMEGGLEKPESEGSTTCGGGMASLLLATQQLGSLMKDLPGRLVREQIDRFSHLQRMIQRHVLEVFENRLLKRRVSLAGFDAIILGRAALVMDVLGGEARDGLIRWYCQHQLGDYQDVFRGNRELAALESVPKRYAWLKRLLLAYEAEHGAIFPSSWRVDFTLCLEFCIITGPDLAKLVTSLVRQGEGKVKLNDDVDLVLLQATIQQTLQFESFLQHKFGMDRRSGLVLSLAFEPALSLFVDAHDIDLDKFINGLSSAPSAGDFEGGSNILASAPELFLLFREMLQDISSLSTKKPLGDLCSVFSKHLLAYSHYLDQCLQTNKVGDGKKNNSSRGINKKITSSSSIKLLCVLVNTADYCRLTIEQLEVRLRKLIDPRCEDEVHFDRVKQNFLARLAAVSARLHQLLFDNLTIAWKSFENIKWNSQSATIKDHETTTRDQDEFVTLLQRSLATDLHLVRGLLLEAAHYGSLCDRLAISILGRFRDQLDRITPLTEVIAQQLLIDLESLRITLIEVIPRNPKYAFLRSAYERLVVREIRNSERILKCLLLSPEPISFFVQNYVVVTTDAEEEHFKRLLAMRGIKTFMQGTYLEEFRKVLPHRPWEGGRGMGSNPGSPGSGTNKNSPVKELAKLNGQLRKLLASITNRDGGNNGSLPTSNTKG